MTFTPVGSLSGANASSFTWAPGAVRNLMVFAGNWSASTITGVSSSNATWTQVVAATACGSRFFSYWLGVATSTSSATVTVAGTGTPVFATQEFQVSSGGANVALDSVISFSSTAGNYGTTAVPAHGAGELCFGFASNASGASAGATSGYTYNANADGVSDGACYNPSCPAAAQTPAWADANLKSGGTVLLFEKPAGKSLYVPQSVKRAAYY